MKLSTKVLTGMSVAALSLVLAGGIKAEAATFSADKTMTITSGQMVSFDAVKDKKGSLSWNAKAKWDTYYGTKVDLSNVKTTKDVYIAVKGSTGPIDVYKINADKKTKFKGAFAASALTITEGTTAITSKETTWANYQYRTELGTWQAMTQNTEIDLTAYEQQGSTLYFHYKGAASVTATADATIKVADVPSGTTVNVSTIPADSFIAKEFKVKVPKLANAPAISVDYNTGVIKAKKGAEYRVGTSFTTAGGTDWKAFDDNYTIAQTTANAFQMRTKATDKKAASKIATYSWPSATAPTITANTAAGASGTYIANVLTWKSDEVENKDKDKAKFEITNATSGDSAKTIVLYKAKMDGTTAKAEADGKAVATLKPGKSVTFTSKKIADGTCLVMQYAGDKKTDVLPSPLATGIKVIYNVKAAPAS